MNIQTGEYLAIAFLSGLNVGIYGLVWSDTKKRNEETKRLEKKNFNRDRLQKSITNNRSVIASLELE